MPRSCPASPAAIRLLIALFHYSLLIPHPSFPIPHLSHHPFNRFGGGAAVGNSADHQTRAVAGIACGPDLGVVCVKTAPGADIAPLVRLKTEASHHAPPKSAPAMSAMTGSFAPQGMKVVVMMVIFLS
jgi:hypothetical protein